MIMKVLILGAGGFIGQNLTEFLSKDKNNFLVLADQKIDHIKKFDNAEYRTINFDENCDFDSYLKDIDIVYHLISTTIPSSKDVVEDIKTNEVVTAKLLDASVRNKIKRFVFISSGGTVYGKDNTCPLKETMETNPICSYGIQKLAIEKLLYLYNYLFNLDYRIIRLSNPYGSYQRPNNSQGIIANFLDRIIKNENINVYGDGSVVRDYIYIDDAIKGICNISLTENTKYKLYNLGSGVGISINELIDVIKKSINQEFNVDYIEARKQDVPSNYLNIERYLTEFDHTDFVSLSDGIKNTYLYLKNR